MSIDKDKDEAESTFKSVRKQIDAVDQELVDLVARRQQLTASVGELKAKLNLPLYDPKREDSIISKIKSKAQKTNVSPDLAEDLVRRIIRDSYINQNNTRREVTEKQTKNIVVVGGKGQLGRLFVSLFQQSGFWVEIVEKETWKSAEKVLANADLVMVAVPIRDTSSVIAKLTGLKANCLLVDITSIKKGPLKVMHENHSGPILGLHPMFGPGIRNLAKQTIVVCHGHKPEQCQWFIELMMNWGAKLTFVSADKHDQLMAMIQVLRHFSTVAYGYHLKEENIDLDQILDLSSPIYELELMMVGRLFAQNSELYSDIIFSNNENIPMIKRFIERLLELVELLEKEDVGGFSRLFEEVSHWFGGHSEAFLSKSNLLLAKANDIKK